MSVEISLENLTELFPGNFSGEQRARAQTLFFKKLSLEVHRYYGGKIQTVPKCGIFGFNWFNVWYTPGVSKISTEIRDNNGLSFALSNRGNLVAVVSDSSRVLGDGDCTPPGGLGVMEGNTMLMKYLGGVDAVALCADSRDKNGKRSPEKLIEFVRMLQPSFGAVNLEDISQPECFRGLDELRDTCAIFPSGTTMPGGRPDARRGDFPNQVNNAVCFPGILKGALLVRAKKDYRRHGAPLRPFHCRLCRKTRHHPR